MTVRKVAPGRLGSRQGADQGRDVNYKMPKQKQKSARAMIGALWGSEEGMTALIFAAERFLRGGRNFS